MDMVLNIAWMEVFVACEGKDGRNTQLVRSDNATRALDDCCPENLLRKPFQFFKF